MQKPNDVRKFVIGAEQAEARGDHAEAERLLRRALVLQEFSLGAEHIEVAKTLNNLAIVSEMNGRLGDAEACYRRAFAIAVAKLAPTDPFFVTSRENLEQFCQARGLPFNSPPVARRSSPDAPIRPPAPPPRVAAPPASAPAASAPAASAPAASAPAASAPPKTAAPPPSNANVVNPGAPDMTIAVPRAAVPPKPVTAPRTTTPATAAPPASMADMPFLSETAISQTSVPTRAAAPPKPVTPPRTAPTAGAARAVPLEDMPFRSEAAKATRSAPDPDATSPMRHSAVPVLAARRGSSRGILLALAALVLIGAGWYWFTSSAPSERAASSAVAPGSDAPAPAAVPAPPGGKPSPPAPSAAAKPETAAPPAAKPTVPPPAPAASAPGVATAPAPPPATTRPSSSVTVVTSQACRNLTRSDAWTCTPATGAQSPGRLYFYTRVASPRDTTIEHRWYRGDRLEQSVPLSIRANAAGYRTYSQLAIGPDRAGSWKVELRTKDGQVLDQQTFTVR